MHMRLGNILDHNRDVPVPGTDCLVIRSGDETLVVVDEGDCVHRAQMLVILLRDLPAVDVILMQP